MKVSEKNGFWPDQSIPKILSWEMSNFAPFKITSALLSSSGEGRWNRTRGTSIPLLRAPTTYYAFQAKQ